MWRWMMWIRASVRILAQIRLHLPQIPSHFRRGAYLPPPLLLHTSLIGLSPYNVTPDSRYQSSLHHIVGIYKQLSIFQPVSHSHPEVLINTVCICISVAKST